MKVIKVQFDGGNSLYDYFCRFEVKVGDKVIVESPYNGYSAVTVIDIIEGGHKAKKEVVNVIDDTEYKARLEARKELQKVEAEIQERLSENARKEFLEKAFAKDVKGKALVKRSTELYKFLTA